MHLPGTLDLHPIFTAAHRSVTPMQSQLHLLSTLLSSLATKQWGGNIHHHHTAGSLASN